MEQVTIGVHSELFAMSGRNINFLPILSGEPYRPTMMRAATVLKLEILHYEIGNKEIKRAA
jgi:hypothetical protein